ncbi:MAG TPA: dihydrofolate reductase family protein [Actinomycetota bacterium]|jgi:dihydrofolate reductase
MRDIVAVEFVSVDGVAEAPEKWTTPYFDDDVGQAMQAGMDASDAMLLGRRTYEDFVAYWPDKTAEDDPYADYINATQKFVVSRTLTSVQWRNSTLITGDVVEELTKLKRQPGKNITIVGSPTLMRSLLRDGLVDRLDVLVFPIVVGSGKRLFEEGIGELPLALVDSRTYKTGVVSLGYAPARS